MIDLEDSYSKGYKNINQVRHQSGCYLKHQPNNESVFKRFATTKQLMEMIVKGNKFSKNEELKCLQFDNGFQFNLKTSRLSHKSNRPSCTLKVASQTESTPWYLMGGLQPEGNKRKSDFIQIDEMKAICEELLEENNFKRLTSPDDKIVSQTLQTEASEACHQIIGDDLRGADNMRSNKKSTSRPTQVVRNTTAAALPILQDVDDTGYNKGLHMKDSQLRITGGDTTTEDIEMDYVSPDNVDNVHQGHKLKKVRWDPNVIIVDDMKTEEKLDDERISNEIFNVSRKRRKFHRNISLLKQKANHYPTFFKYISYSVNPHDKK